MSQINAGVKGRYVSIESKANGNLAITGTTEGIIWLNDHLHEINGVDLWDGLLEDFAGQGIYERLDGADAGVMSDEIPTNGYNVKWNGGAEYKGAAATWVFENFQNVFEIEKLSEGETVHFTLVK